MEYRPADYHIARRGWARYAQGVPSRQVPDFYVMPEEYDILHAAGSAEEVRALLRIERAHVATPRGRPRTWLEPACGTGRLLRLAAARGRNVIGFDREGPMVRYALRRVREAASRRASLRPREARVRGTVFCADMTDFGARVRARSVDLAFNLINTVRHLPSDSAMLAHFAQVARALRPGGAYAVGLSLSSYGNESPTEDIWMGRRGLVSVRQVVQYLPAPGGRGKRARDEVCINHMTVTRGRRETDHDFVYTLRAYDLRQWSALIARSRLRIDAVLDDQGGPIVPTEPGYAVFILRARGQ